MTSRSKRVLLSLSGVALIGIFLWMRSLASWRPVKMGGVSPSYAIGFLSSDGQTALRMTDDFAYCDIANIRNGTTTDWPESEHSISAFSNNSPEWAAVTGYKNGGGELRVRDIASGRLKRVFHWPTGNAGKRVSGCEVLPGHDEKTIGVLDSSMFFQWSLETGRLLHKVALRHPFEASGNQITCFATSSDGTRIMGCRGRYKSQGRIWQVESGNLSRSWTTTAHDYPAFFSSDARIVIYASLPTTAIRTYQFVDTSTGKVPWEMHDAIFSDPTEGTEISLPQKNDCDVRDIFTGHLLRHLPGPRQTDGAIIRVTSDWIYTRNGDGEIFRWRAR